MESFVLSRKDCRNIYLRIYFLIVQLFAVNFILAYVMTYVDGINIWFDQYTSDEGKPGATVLAQICSLMPIILIVVYNAFRKIGYTLKMTFINLLIIFLALYTHAAMLMLGWKFVLLCFGCSLIAMGILMFAASRLNIKKHINYNKIKFYTFILFIVYLIASIFGKTVTFIGDMVVFVFGLGLAFFETQALRSKLVYIRNQRQLDNLLYPFIVNMIGNCLLINFYYDTVKMFIKYFAISEKD